MIDKIVKVITVLVAIALLGYIVFLKMPGASASSKDSVAEVTALDLYTAYTQDEKSAQGKYLGQAVEISGAIYDKYEDETGAPVVLLGPEDADPYALITLESSEKKSLNTYNIGDPITIKAICTGILLEVTLNKGLIL